MKFRMTHYEWLNQLRTTPLQDLITRHDERISAELTHLLLNVPKEAELLASSYAAAYRMVCFAISSIDTTGYYVSDEELVGHTHLFYHYYAMKRCAEQIFFLSDDLRNCFADTNMDIPAALFKQPYFEYYVAFDTPMESTEGRCNGMYLMTEEDDGEITLRIMPVATPTAHRYALRDARHSYFRFTFSSNSTSIQRDFENWLPVEMEHQPEFVERIMSIAINLSLYLCSSEKDLAPAPVVQRQMAAKSLMKKARQKNGLKATMVGHTKSYKYSGRSGTGKPLHRQHIVRGHWRNQACGKNYSERRPVFIKPYVKGEDFGGALSRKYVVK